MENSDLAHARGYLEQRVPIMNAMLDALNIESEAAHAERHDFFDKVLKSTREIEQLQEVIKLVTMSEFPLKPLVLSKLLNLSGTRVRDLSGTLDTWTATSNPGAMRSIFEKFDTKIQELNDAYPDVPQAHISKPNLVETFDQLGPKIRQAVAEEIALGDKADPAARIKAIAESVDILGLGSRDLDMEREVASMTEGFKKADVGGHEIVDQGDIDAILKAKGDTKEDGDQGEIDASEDKTDQ